MINIIIPDSSGRRLPFFLATEEWVARNLPDHEYFFAWRVNPTVICGRHQEIDKEVNLDYCLLHGIDVVRRRSGGGTVYADKNNWMFSYISPGDGITTTFTRYTQMIAETLRSLGIEAEPTGRNDILIAGAKVSGNAFYHLPNRSIVHGTMLLDIDLDRISHAITPDRAKLESNGVKSVASRVTSLHACGLRMDVDEFGVYVTENLCGGSITLTSEDLNSIEELEQKYYNPDFLKINTKKENSGTRRSKLVEGVGWLTASVRKDERGNLSDIAITGDFFADHDRLEHWAKELYGVNPERGILSQKLRELGSPICGVKTGILLDLLSD